MSTIFRLTDEYRRIIVENPSPALMESAWVKRYSGLVERIQSGDIVPFPRAIPMARAVSVALQRQRLRNELRRRLSRESVSRRSSRAFDTHIR